MPQKTKHSGKAPQRDNTKKNGVFYFNISLRVLHSLLMVGLAFLILGGSLALGIGAGYFAYLVEDTATPTKKELQQDFGDLAQTSKLTYGDNSEIAKIRSDLLRTSIKSDQISDWVKKAIVSTEDEYFYEHDGVVPKAVVRALLSEATGFGGGGGSTLTQQLVKQQVLTSETTFKRKANEILLAMEVEKFFSKDEIITMYLNVSPFGRNNRGQNIAGVEEAAKGIFGKSAKDLNLPQAAFLAGLPQSPIIYSPYDGTGQIKENQTPGMERKDFVLFSMYRAHAISKKEYDEARKYDLKKDFQPKRSADVTDHGFLYYAVLGQAQEIVAKKLADEDKVDAKEFKKEKTYNAYLEKAFNKLVNGGYTVKSTINKKIYNAMQAGVAEYGYMLDNYDGDDIEVGNVMMDNKTGKILGFVGGRDFAKNQNNHAFDTARAAGSSIKPILVYGPAVDQGLIGSQTRVSDYAAKWQAGENKGDDIVNATNEGSNTFQTVQEALNESTNITAYHVYQDLMNSTKKNIAYDQYLSKMNYPASDNWTVESAPLGPMDVTTLQQTNGYQTLANGGVYQEGYLIESITDAQGNAIFKHEVKGTQVYSKAAASIMNNMMRNVLEAGITTPFLSQLNGLNWYLGNADWVGKTGSSDYYRDSWLVVSTPNVTVSSWSGVKDNSEKNDQDAGSRTGKYMAYLINRIYMADPDAFGIDQKFKLDSSVKKVSVSKATGQLPGQFSYNGTTQTAPLDSTTSYWAKGGPGQSEYKFGIGGTDANYANYWGKIYGSNKKKTTDSNSSSGNSSTTNNNSNANSNTNSNSNSNTTNNDANTTDDNSNTTGNNTNSNTNSNTTNNNNTGGNTDTNTNNNTNTNNQGNN